MKIQKWLVAIIIILVFAVIIGATLFYSAGFIFADDAKTFMGCAGAAWTARIIWVYALCWAIYFLPTGFITMVKDGSEDIADMFIDSLFLWPYMLYRTIKKRNGTQACRQKRSLMSQ